MHDLTPLSHILDHLKMNMPTAPQLLSIALKVLAYLRPQFYNRITWAIVITGLTLMSTPLWLVVVELVIESQLHISMGDSNQVGWGFALCFVGLVYHLLNTSLHEVASAINSKGKIAKTIEHDRNIFFELDGILNESSLRSTLESLEVNHATRLKNSEAILNFVRAAESSGKTFLTQEIKKKSEQLCKAASDLSWFISNEFDEYPYCQAVDNFQICLAPRLNCDRAGSWYDMPKYDALIAQLFSKTSALMTAYQEWRTAVKEVTYV